MSNILWTHGLQHTRLPCPSPSPRTCPSSNPSSWWCYPTISSSAIPFSCLQFFQVSGYLLMSQFFTSGGQSIRAPVSASVLQMNMQGWFPLGLTGLISLQFKRLSRVFSSTPLTIKTSKVIREKKRVPQRDNQQWWTSPWGQTCREGRVRYLNRTIYYPQTALKNLQRFWNHLRVWCNLIMQEIAHLLPWS